MLLTSIEYFTEISSEDGTIPKETMQALMAEQKSLMAEKEESLAQSITIMKEEYVQLRRAAEENERFFNWDISSNWPDYDNALQGNDTDGDVPTIDEWEEVLRSTLRM